MSNLFDNIQKAAFAVCSEVFGTDASWSPSDSSPVKTGRVLFRCPTEKDEFADEFRYDPVVRVAEYHEEVLPGLFEAVRANKSENLTVDGTLYFVRKVLTYHDGKTFKAFLEPK